MTQKLYINVVIVDGVGCLPHSLLLLPVQLEVLPLAGCGWLLPRWSAHTCRGGEDRAAHYPGAGQVSSYFYHFFQISPCLYILHTLIHYIFIGLFNFSFSRNQNIHECKDEFQKRLIALHVVINRHYL